MCVACVSRFSGRSTSVSAATADAEDSFIFLLLLSFLRRRRITPFPQMRREGWHKVVKEEVEVFLLFFSWAISGFVSKLR